MAKPSLLADYIATMNKNGVCYWETDGKDIG